MTWPASLARRCPGLLAQAERYGCLSIGSSDPGTPEMADHGYGWSELADPGRRFNMCDRTTVRWQTTSETRSRQIRRGDSRPDATFSVPEMGHPCPKKRIDFRK